MNLRGATGGSRPGLMMDRSALRADCAALLGLAAPLPNSLRGLRPLRSTIVSESEVEARTSGARAARLALLADP
ncbi:MAG: hypothetical protein U1E89_01055 [Burkholderiaceae bacterium]